MTSMWTSRTEKLNHGSILKVTVELDSFPVSYATVLQSWRDDAQFRAKFISLLADAPFAVFRWETPPITTLTADRPFEFVLVDSPELAKKPDVNAFAEHFSEGGADGGNAGGGEIVQFSNLGHDAILVVPRPGTPISCYSHLGAFIRQAPTTQRHALWEAVGAVMQRRLGTSNKPVWLSTAGAGVAWLHVRLDDRPKYYGYAPYRKSP